LSTKRATDVSTDETTIIATIQPAHICAFKHPYFPANENSNCAAKRAAKRSAQFVTYRYPFRPANRSSYCYP
jgi:hypothetical protein